MEGDHDRSLVEATRKMSISCHRTSAFHLFPTEIIVKILTFLEPPQLVKCRLVDRAFDQIICQTLLLQYILQLAMAGYEDGPHTVGTGPDISKRLDALRALGKSWQDPQPQITSKSFPLPLPDGWKNVYWVATEAVFVRHSCPRTPDAGPRTRLDIVKLHDIMESCPPPVKTLLFENNYNDSIVNPTVQLVVLIGKHDGHPSGILDLMSYIDGQRDHRAQINPIILTEGPDDRGAIWVQDLSKEFLVASKGYIHEFGSKNHLHLYHWPSGSLLRSWCSAHKVEYHDTIITPQGFLLVSACHRHQSDPSEPYIEIYSLPHGPSPSGVCHLATFLLPALFESPLSSYWSASPTSADSLSHFDFTCSRCCLLHLRIHGHYGLFVFTTTLIRYSLAPRACESAPPVFPWVEWGPNSTRFVTHSQDVILSGCRVVFPSEIWDFTPAHVLGVSGAASNITHSEPTEKIIDIETIETSLPYLRIKHGLPQVESGFPVRSFIESDGHATLLQILPSGSVAIDIDIMTF